MQSLQEKFDKYLRKFIKILFFVHDNFDMTAFLFELSTIFVIIYYMSFYLAFMQNYQNNRKQVFWTTPLYFSRNLI